MNLKTWKVAGVLLWGGAVLLILGLVLSYPRLAPYVSAAFGRDPIPTAPPLEFDTTPGPQEEAVIEVSEDVLLPFEGEDSKEAEKAPESPPSASEDDPLPPVTPTISEADDVAPTPTMAALVGTLPVHMRIPSIDLDAPVTSIGWEIVTRSGKSQAVWQVPNWRAAGWHNTSALVGVRGNTVLNGHNTGRGEVFRDLYKLEEGAVIEVEGQDGQLYTYEVGEKYILPEAGQSLEVRRKNARYIQQTPDERLTLVTCHPYGSLANRLLIIAYPTSDPDEIPRE